MVYLVAGYGRGMMTRELALVAAAVTIIAAVAVAEPATVPAPATTRAAATRPLDGYVVYRADYAAWADEAAKVLAPVASVADARAAVPTVRRLAAAIAALEARGRALPPLSAADRERLKATPDDALASATDRAFREVDRITGDPVLCRLFEPDGHGFLKPTAEAIRPAATTQPAVAATGRVDAEDALAADLVAWRAEAARTISAVRTPADARAAVPAVRRLDETLDTLRARARALGPASPEVAERIRAKYRDQTRASEQFDLDVLRITRDPALNAVLCADGDGFLKPALPATQPASGSSRPVTR